MGKNPHKLAQNDIEARWAKKNNESFYGHKDHVNVDQDTKLITTWKVTSAQIHDSQVLEEILQSPEMGGADVYADSAYRSNAQEETLIVSRHTSQIHEKGISVSRG